MYNASHVKANGTTKRYADIAEMDIKEYPKQIEDINLALGTHIILKLTTGKIAKVFLPLNTKDRFYIEQNGKTIYGGTYPKIGEGAAKPNDDDGKVQKRNLK